MKSFKTVDSYLANVKSNIEILMVLRRLLNSTEMQESIKWGAPVYTLKGKNVIGMAAFKSYVGLWFYQGVFLKDSAKVLINAQENKTKALRQWRFSTLDELNEKLILEYVNEAINNQKQGKELEIERNKKIVLPEELEQEFEKDKLLQSAFELFTPGKQREFVEYISEAKRSATKYSRVQKIIPLIHQNIGLNDKYRK